jgi:hypothetical protein
MERRSPRMSIVLTLWRIAVRPAVREGMQPDGGGGE